MPCYCVKSIQLGTRAFANGFYFGLVKISSQSNGSSQCSAPSLKTLEVDSSTPFPKDLPGKTSLLEKCNEDVSEYSPYHVPSFNFAAYVNKSPTLQKLVHLGVDLSKIERKKGVPELILKLHFERDMVKHIQFLTDIGVPADELGNFITNCPFIFAQSIEDLKVRTCYLQSKKFKPSSISRIVQKNPKWLMYSTQDIDRRLGYFQQNFELLGNEVRLIATKMPKIITYNLRHIENTKFAVREEMGFSMKESKDIIIQKPKVYTLNRESLVSRFVYIHNTMGIPQRLIVEQLGGLLCREERLKQRHEFLVSLGRAQYDPLLPSYIALENIVTGNDADFCKNIAGTSVITYNKFLKSL